MVIKIEVVVFWIVTPCSDVVGHQHSGGCYHYFLHKQHYQVLLIYEFKNENMLKVEGSI
jgi:hypothetical protein